MGQTLESSRSLGRPLSHLQGKQASSVNTAKDPAFTLHTGIPFQRNRRGSQRALAIVKRTKGILLLVLLLLLVIVGKSEAKRSCRRHQDCQGDQVCEFGSCRCPAGFILWKWSCYAQVSRLGDSCSVSAQCQYRTDRHRHCNPLNKRCACELNYNNVRGQCMKMEFSTVKPHEDLMSTTIKALIEATTSSSTTPFSHTEHKNKILNKVIQHLNNNVRKNAHPQVVTQNPVVYHDTARTHHHSPHHLDPEQIHTLLYIGLAFFVVFTVGTISAIYMRSMREKRRNQATIRGLLDIMSGNNNGSGDTNSVSNAGGVIYESTGSLYGNIIHSTSGMTDSDAASISLNLGNRRPSRLVLEPLGPESLSHPAPHLSNPILPPIRGKKRTRNTEDIRYAIPRPESGANELETPSLAAITESLNALNERSSQQLHGFDALMGGGGSVATFPHDTPPEYDDVIVRTNNAKNAAIEDGHKDFKL